MEVNKVKELFNEKFYKPTYQDWRIDEIKAGKDIVGKKYEDFREAYYENMGFEIGNGNKIFGSSYDCDTVVMKDGEVVILEEDKAHYVDSCFLGRALANCAEVMNQCIELDIKAPYFVLSCSTKMNNFQDIFENRIKLYREDIQELIREKFTYLPLCQHGRVQKSQYFLSEENCFELNDELIENQNNFVKSIK
tara:strand:+ start:229 stop:807 length:579 start_codon:yes stop_codon:yes gene_type:complete